MVTLQLEILDYIVTYLIVGIVSFAWLLTIKVMEV